MDRISERVAYAQHGAERVGARAQVRLLAQELERVSLLLQGVCGGVGRAVDLKLVGLDLDALALALRGHERALHVDARAGRYGLQGLVVELREVEHDLQVLDGASVVERDELDILVAPAGAYPALDVDFRSDSLRAFGEQLPDG